MNHNSCNCIQFNGSYYIPCQGCPTGLDSAVEKYSRALAVSGFKYEKSKSELMKSKSINREDYLNAETNRKRKQNNNPNCLIQIIFCT